MRKSSLATVNKTGRKTSAVSFKENNTTIEFSDDQTESSGKDKAFLSIINLLFSDVVETIVGRKGIAQ